MRMAIVVISALAVCGCSFDTRAISGFARLDAGINDVGSPDLSVTDGGHEATVQSDATSDTLVQQDAILGDTAVQSDSHPPQTDTLAAADSSPDTSLPQDAGQSDAAPSQTDAQPADTQVAQDDAAPQQDTAPADTTPPPPCEGLVAVYADPASLQDCVGIRCSDHGVVGLAPGAEVGPISGIGQIACKNGTGYVLPTSCEVQYPTPQTVPGCAHLGAWAGLLAGQPGCDYLGRCAP